MAKSEDAPKLSELLKEDAEDCFSCRVIGSAAFIGLGGYTYWSGLAQLKKQEEVILRSGSRWGIGARRLGIHGIAAGMIGMGLYRWFM
ncbi:hypothetical protein RUND412_004090 [Rhizina undulata]